MASTAILFPSIAMALLTLALIGYMGFNRNKAVMSRKVPQRYYKLYKEGDEPDELRLITRHVQNHFEVPPLFHMAVLLIFVTNNVTNFAVICAWGYVVARCAHSYVHLSSNVVLHRFLVFGVSLLFLLILWGHLLFALL